MHNNSININTSKRLVKNFRVLYHGGFSYLSLGPNTVTLGFCKRYEDFCDVEKTVQLTDQTTHKTIQMSLETYERLNISDRIGTDLETEEDA